MKEKIGFVLTNICFYTGVLVWSTLITVATFDELSISVGDCVLEINKLNFDYNSCEAPKE